MFHCKRHCIRISLCAILNYKLNDIYNLLKSIKEMWTKWETMDNKDFSAYHHSSFPCTGGNLVVSLVLHATNYNKTNPCHRKFSFISYFNSKFDIHG